MTVVVALLGLIFLIVIHELGHMLTAKAMGVRVPEFAVGFGPPLIKKKFGKTVYSFRIILLGGFAKMAGMGDGAEGPDTYHAKAAWRRALIILAGPAGQRGRGGPHTRLRLHVPGRRHRREAGGKRGRARIPRRRRSGSGPETGSWRSTVAR